MLILLGPAIGVAAPATVDVVTIDATVVVVVVTDGIAPASGNRLTAVEFSPS